MTSSNTSFQLALKQRHLKRTEACGPHTFNTHRLPLFPMQEKQQFYYLFPVSAHPSVTLTISYVSEPMTATILALWSLAGTCQMTNCYVL